MNNEMSRLGAMGAVVCWFFCLAFPALAAEGVSATAGAAIRPPIGLINSDPQARLEAINEVRERRILSAASKLANMAQKDPYTEIRSAACLALAGIGAKSKVPILRDITLSDPDSDVRRAAARAVHMLVYGVGEDASLPRTIEEKEDRHANGVVERDNYKQPDLSLHEEKLETRIFAVGIGTMGGYGIASLNFRGRIPTGDQILPYVGIEVGSGWTPPEAYRITAGPVGGLNSSDDKWKIIPAVGSVLLYFHRMHYVPIRVGWDVGRGVYGILGYGFEWLNPEGFFSAGVEVGITIQPDISNNIGSIVECGAGGICDQEELWPVVPCVRFSLQFYII